MRAENVDEAISDAEAEEELRRLIAAVPPGATGAKIRAALRRALDWRAAPSAHQRPVEAFVSECCVVEPGASVGVTALFVAWRAWSANHPWVEDETGEGRPGSKHSLGRGLGAFPQVRMAQARVSGGRERRYEGIRLRTEVTA